MGAWVAVQGVPISDGLIPFNTAYKPTGLCVGAGGQQAAFEVVQGFVVHTHHAGTGTGFDGHVADRHAAFHAQGADGDTAKFDGVAGAARRANFADDGQHDVFAGATACESAFHFDQHIFGLFGQKGLGGHDVFDFTGANAVCQCAKGAVGGRV